jgi:hypothetical protein
MSGLCAVLIMCKVRYYDVRKFAFMNFGVGKKIFKIFESFKPIESSEEKGADVYIHATFLFDDGKSNEIGNIRDPARVLTGFGDG